MLEDRGKLIVSPISIPNRDSNIFQSYFLENGAVINEEFQSLIGSLSHFSLLALQLHQAFPLFQSLIGILTYFNVRDFLLIGVTQPISIPNRDSNIFQLHTPQNLITIEMQYSKSRIPLKTFILPNKNAARLAKNHAASKSRIP